jgi:hypothetical protein
MRPKCLTAASFALLCAMGGVPRAAAQLPRQRPAVDNDASDAAPQPAARPFKPRPRGPEIFYCLTPDTTCRTAQETFSIAELRDLFVFVAWPGVAGAHVQTVEFYLPAGSLYSSNKTRFVIGGVFVATAGSPSRNLVAPAPAAPHLMADANRVHTEGIPSLLMKSRGDFIVLTVLPVAGTYITQRGLSGQWRVRVLLDERVALESGFTLKPVAPRARAFSEEDAE